MHLRTVTGAEIKQTKKKKERVTIIHRMFACSQKKRDERKKNEENEKMGIRIKTKMNKKKRVRYYVERKGREKKKKEVTLWC